MGKMDFRRSLQRILDSKEEPEMLRRAAVAALMEIYHPDEPPPAADSVPVISGLSTYTAQDEEGED